MFRIRTRCSSFVEDFGVFACLALMIPGFSPSLGVEASGIGPGLDSGSSSLVPVLTLKGLGQP